MDPAAIRAYALRDWNAQAAAKRAYWADRYRREGPVASAEDLVVMKVLAGRPKDVEDIAAVLSAQHRSFDATYARQTLQALEEALGQSDLLPLFERLWSETDRA